MNLMCFWKVSDTFVSFKIPLVEDLKGEEYIRKSFDIKLIGRNEGDLLGGRE